MAIEKFGAAAQRRRISLELQRPKRSVDLHFDTDEIVSRFDDKIDPVRAIAHRTALGLNAVAKSKLFVPVWTRQSRFKGRGQKSLRDASAEFREPQACKRAGISNFVTLETSDRPRVDDAPGLFGMRQALLKILECTLNLP